MIKINKNIAYSVTVVGLMIFSSLFVAIPTQVSAAVYTSCSAKCINNPVWANSNAHLYIVVSNSGDEGVTINVELDYDETYMTITSCKAVARCIEYQGVDNGEKIIWNNVYVPPVGNPSGGPIDSCEAQMFSANVKAIISKCAPNGMEIVNNVWYERLDNGKKYGPKTAKIEVINPQICGFNIDHKVKAVEDVSAEWSDEIYVNIGDIIRFKTEMTNTGNKVYVSDMRSLLPGGLEYVPGSAKVNNVPKSVSTKTLFDGTIKLGFDLDDRDSRLQKIGLITNGKTLTIKFDAKVLEHGDIINEIMASVSTIDYGFKAVPISDTVIIHSTDNPPENPEGPGDHEDSEEEQDPGVLHNQPPLIYIFKPEAGKMYFKDKEFSTQLKQTFAIGPITLDVDAIDLDGEIKQVEFKINGELKQTIIEPPYEYTYDEKAFGFYSFSIKAYDNENLSSEETIDLFILNRGR